VEVVVELVPIDVVSPAGVAGHQLVERHVEGDERRVVRVPQPFVEASVDGVDDGVDGEVVRYGGSSRVGCDVVLDGAVDL